MGAHLSSLPSLMLPAAAPASCANHSLLANDELNLYRCSELALQQQQQPQHRIALTRQPRARCGTQQGARVCITNCINGTQDEHQEFPTDDDDDAELRRWLWYNLVKEDTSADGRTVWHKNICHTHHAKPTFATEMCCPLPRLHSFSPGKRITSTKNRAPSDDHDVDDDDGPLCHLAKVIYDCRTNARRTRTACAHH